MQVDAHCIELLAVVIILAGVAGGPAPLPFRWTSQQGCNEYKGTLGKALLLGLNVLVAADIVRTVALEPTITKSCRVWGCWCWCIRSSVGHC